MADEKSVSKKKLGNMFRLHFWLKLIALVLAILVWLYVRGEITAR